MSLKIENSRRKDESRPVCMDLNTGDTMPIVDEKFAIIH
jgi:hypothetical protein